jgi:quercetin dioxygenase-like cupin family protein
MGLSVRAFADRAGFSASFISQLENGQVSPSIASLGEIASKLNVTLVDLMARSTESQSPIVRAKDREGFRSSWSKAQLAALTHNAGVLEALIVTLDPDGSSGGRPSPAHSEQFAFVTAGSLTLTLGDDEIPLRRGDAVQIDARTRHRWHNPSRSVAEILLVSVRSR